MRLLGALVLFFFATNCVAEIVLVKIPFYRDGEQVEYMSMPNIYITPLRTIHFINNRHPIYYSWFSKRYILTENGFILAKDKQDLVEHGIVSSIESNVPGPLGDVSYVGDKRGQCKKKLFFSDFQLIESNRRTGSYVKYSNAIDSEFTFESPKGIHDLYKVNGISCTEIRYLDKQFLKSGKYAYPHYLDAINLKSVIIKGKNALYYWEGTGTVVKLPGSEFNKIGDYGFLFYSAEMNKSFYRTKNSVFVVSKIGLERISLSADSKIYYIADIPGAGLISIFTSVGIHIFNEEMVELQFFDVGEKYIDRFPPSFETKPVREYGVLPFTLNDGIYALSKQGNPFISAFRVFK